MPTYILRLQNRSLFISSEILVLLNLNRNLLILDGALLCNNHKRQRLTGLEQQIGFIVIADNLVVTTHLISLLRTRIL